MTRIEGELSIMVEDNGIGFKYEEKLKADGMGLQNLNRRVEKLQGSMHVDSAPGYGTTVIIEIPLIAELWYA